MCLLKLLKNMNKNNNKKLENTKPQKDEKHFQWLDGKKDKLTTDEVIEIEEILEDDDDFI